MRDEIKITIAILSGLVCFWCVFRLFAYRITKWFLGEDGALYDSRMEDQRKLFRFIRVFPPKFANKEVIKKWEESYWKFILLWFVFSIVSITLILSSSK